MRDITSEELKEKIKNKENFYLDIKASWCGPCKALLATVKDVATELKNNGSEKNIYVFDVDQDMDFVGSVLKVRSVPTTKLFVNGEEEFSKTGLLRKDEIKELLNKI
jgi:thioredoxin-like negative regulator of GroEL